MKVSVKWMQKLAGETKIMPAGGIDELVEIIGAQLGAVESVEYLGAKYRKVVVAKVIACDKHPNADKLSLCLIDDGGVVKGVERNDGGYVQVVCGAPNVRQGLLVAWLPPTAIVPSSADSDPFVLEAREIRGYVSNGMLASAHELALGDDHSGILEIDATAKPGDSFAELLQLDDYVIDIENKMFTHRPDCFGQLGVAREIAGVTGQAFRSPAAYLDKPAKQAGSGPPLKVDNQLPQQVTRFMSQVFTGVKVGPSPAWLQAYLARAGQKPINNIVDITNYYMLQTGQPMHAYDYDKVKALSDGDACLVVRMARPGEKLALLNGKTIEPRAEAIVIATDKQAIGLGGVMGGAETEVDADTKNIIMECANFDMYSIRRTSMEHGLFTDAVTRFSKGQSPLQCDRVLAWAAATVTEVAGGQAGQIYDVAVNLSQPAVVTAGAEFINDRLGVNLSAADMARLLENVEFEVRADNDQLVVQPPFWRTDIEIAEDLVEEIGRLYGYDRLPSDLPQRSMRPASRNRSLELKSHIRQILSAAGANELLTYSFVHGELLEKVGQNPADAYTIKNAISPDLQHYRLSLIPSLLDRVHPNIKAGTDELALFEMNPTHNKQHDTRLGNALPAEIAMLTLVYSANDKASHAGGAPYFVAMRYLEHLLARLGTRPRVERLAKDPGYPITQPFDYRRSALVYDSNDNFIGVVGEFKASVRRNLKLPAFTAGFELSLDNLQQSARQASYRAKSRYPSVQQDVSLKVPKDLAYGELYQLIENQVSEQKPQHSQFRLEPIDIYQREGDLSHKQVTLRLTIAATDRTLTADAVNQLLDEVSAVAGKQYAAERI